MNSDVSFYLENQSLYVSQVIHLYQCEQECPIYPPGSELLTRHVDPLLPKPICLVTEVSPVAPLECRVLRMYEILGKCNRELYHM